MRFADHSTGKPYAEDPAVVFFRCGYWLYYSLPPRAEAGRNGWAIGVARSRDGEGWEKVAELLPEQDCERNGLCAPGAVALDGRPFVRS